MEYISSRTRKVNLLSLPTEISDEIYRQLLPCCVIRIVSQDERRRWICRFVNPGRKHLPSPFYPGYKYWDIMKPGPTELPVNFNVTSASQLRAIVYDLSFLRTCSQVYAQASRLLYSMNIFEFSLSCTGHLDAMDFAGGILNNISPLSRQWMQHLAVEGIQPWRVTWGSSITDTVIYTNDEDFNSFMSPLQILCRIIGEMNLRHLALGFALPYTGSWQGNFDDVPWVVALLGTFRKKDSGARVVLFWTERTPNARIWRKTSAKEEFLRQLASHWTETRIADGARNGTIGGGEVQFI